MTRIKFPPKSPCPICLTCCENNNSLQCQYCKNHFHNFCSKTSKKQFLKLKANNKFKCSLCCTNRQCSHCDTVISENTIEATFCIKCKKNFCVSCTNLSKSDFKSLRKSGNPFICQGCKEFSKCSVCSKSCIDWPNYEQFIPCALCECVYHLKCCKLNRKQFFKRGSDIQTLPFYCKVCIKENLPFANIPKTKFNEINSEKNTNILNSMSPIQNRDNTSCELCLECNPDCENCTVCNDLYRICDNCNDCNLDDIETLNSLINQRKKSEITIIHINIRSLTKHKHEIEQLLFSIDNPPDILCLSETKLNNKSNLQDVGINGYSLFANNSESNFGGTAIYVSNMFSSKNRTDLEINIPGEVETSVVELQPKTTHNKQKSQPLLVVSLYRHPHDNHDEFLQALGNKLNPISDKYKIIILGDTNIDTFQNSQNTKKYKNLLLCLNLRNLITNHFTRLNSNGGTLIDHLLTNISCKNVKSGILQYDISDHLPIYGIVDLETHKPTTERVTHVRKFDESKQNVFCSFLSQSLLNYSKESDNLDPNDSLEKLISCIKGAYNSTFPLKKLTRRFSRKFRKPWITSSVLTQIKKKHKLYKKYLGNKTNENYECYKLQRNTVKRKIESSKKDYYCKLFNQNKRNAKKTWNCINTILNKTQKAKNPLPEELTDKDGNSLTKQNHVANRLNDFFVKKGPNLASKIKSSNVKIDRFLKHRNRHSFKFFRVTEEEIKKIVNELQIGKASGFDEISPQILKWSITLISQPLCKIINNCIEKGKYPDILKIAKVIALHKGGDKTDVDNYRPISILSQINKVIEKLIHSRLVSFLRKHKIISNQQFGFRKMHNTSHSISCLYEKLITNLENKHDSAIVLIDLKAAFDTIDKSLLLEKLDHYGIRGNTLKLLTSYLTDRKQYIKSNDIESVMLNVICGVPQGSVLGPLLFIIFINDIFNCSLFDPVLFADDAALILHAKNLKKLSKLVNREAAKFLLWLDVNKLTLNYKKTKFMLVTNRTYTERYKSKFRVNINKQNIERISEFKYLGVLIDHKLRWNKHVDYLKVKIAKAAGAIKKTRAFMPMSASMMLYNSLVDSHLRYGIVSWGTCANSLKLPLQRILNRIILSLHTNSTNTHNTTNTRLIKILNLSNLYTYETAKFMHSLAYKYNPPAFDNAFSEIQHDHHTRFRTNAQFQLINTRTNTGQRSIKYAGVKCWANIPLYLKSKEKRKSFSKLLKQELLSQQRQHSPLPVPAPPLPSPTPSR